MSIGVFRYLSWRRAAVWVEVFTLELFRMGDKLEVTWNLLDTSMFQRNVIDVVSDVGLKYQKDLPN